MKKALKKISSTIYYYEDGKCVDGVPVGISGDLSGISGDLDNCEITEEDRKRGITVEELTN